MTGLRATTLFPAGRDGAFDHLDNSPGGWNRILGSSTVIVGSSQSASVRPVPS
jgi:hypothetical protein